ncbi:hypothetical protein EV143_11813 [Flavobacterium chryseum]|uniref:hypothetical protein n=1 Tax=Flavobacterium sp. P3160 TaxID=2512113 RepID=UPI00105B4CD2|nr:hypothetical protein [Flavobacterium sp. P3160]TDO68829.1 hypothetical protein EV143_11813 [Flavobacterium sp. P3160]
MILLIILTIIVVLAVCWLWAKFVFAFFNLLSHFIFKSKKTTENIYIEAQKDIDDNERQYQEYLEWMSKNGGEVPIKKVITKEQNSADVRINLALGKYNNLGKNSK